VPFLVADLRLLERFSVGLGGASLAQERGLGGFAREVIGGLGGGTGFALVLLLLLAGGGLALLAARNGPFAAFAGGVFAASALLLIIARAGDSAPLSSRYFIFLLPLWAVLIGAAVARLGIVGVAGLAALIFLAHGQAIKDPRVLEAAKPESLTVPAEWVRARVGERDVLFPYSSVYLSALPEAARATVVSRARPELLLRELDRAEFPVRRAFIAAPRDGSWRVIETEGPFADRVAVLHALRRGVSSLEPDPYTLKALRALDAALAHSRAAVIIPS
jgi:hypothetical protein